MAIILISLLPIFSFSLTFLIIILSHFRPICSPSGHHEFNFDHSLFFFFLRSRHTLWRARKYILPLIRLNFTVLSTSPKLPTGVAAWPLLKFSFVSGVLGLQIRRGWTRWKANTPSYNFYDGPSLDSIIFRSKFPQEPGQRICPVLSMEKVPTIFISNPTSPSI
jgi:hypothetical protein